MADNLNTSDVYQRYTAKFTWESNQVGHAGMGFFFTLLIVLAAARLGGAPWWGFVFAIVPVVKDVGDYLADACPSGRLFPVQYRELVLDGLADNLFWGTGCVVAVGLGLIAAPGISVTVWAIYWIVALPLFGGLIFLAYRHFTGEKACFDKSALPYYFRLPNFDRPLADLNVAQIGLFLARGPETPRFLLIGGGPGTGKTTLGTAIAGGLTSKRWGCKRVRYYTASKLLDFIEGGGVDGKESDPQEPWKFAEAEVLVVDDLPRIEKPEDFDGHPIAAAIATAADSELLDDKAVVWMLGGSGETGPWRGWLKQFLAADERIHAIDLGAPVVAHREPPRHPRPVLGFLCPYRKILARGFFVLLGVVLLFAVATFIVA